MIILRGGRVVTPDGLVSEDLAISDGLITRATAKGESIDCTSMIVSPGFIDLHVHFREPGESTSETIESGSRAAAIGGYTAVCVMPNTSPPIDSAALCDQVFRRGQECGLVDVFPIGSITAARAGTHLAPMGAMAHSAARVRMFSDDGDPVPNALVMRRALEYSKIFDAVIVDHAEDPALRKGHMHEGVVSARLGLAAIPAEAEEIFVRRDIALARLTGGRLHIAHLSTKQAAQAVREAKAEGVQVTCEVTPHHLALTDEAVASFDPNFKVAPPLRSADHIEALKQACADRTIDAIATDHAPHASHLKDTHFDHAPCGMLGLETAFGVAITELVVTGICSIERVIEMLTTAPARILGRTEHGTLTPGSQANICVFDPEATWTVEPEALQSPSRNTPFACRKLTGKVIHTMLRGRFTVRDSELV